MDKIILVTIAKFEEQYIEEWINGHKNLGFDRIIFYDNNPLENKDQYNILKPGIDSEYVVYKDFRGIEKAQIKAYKDSLNFPSEYVAFFDLDEFLYVDCNLKEYIEKFNRFDCIRLPGIVYTDNNLVYNSFEPVLERFTEYVQNLDAEFKFPYKGIYKQCALNIDKMNSPHRLGVKKVCDQYGKELGYGDIPTINIERTHLKHFMFKTAEEAYKKIYKGDVLFGNNFRTKLIPRFFKVNIYSDIKNDILNGHFIFTH